MPKLQNRIITTKGAHLYIIRHKGVKGPGFSIVSANSVRQAKSRLRNSSEVKYVRQESQIFDVEILHTADQSVFEVFDGDPTDYS